MVVRVLLPVVVGVVVVVVVGLLVAVVVCDVVAVVVGVDKAQSANVPDTDDDNARLSAEAASSHTKAPPSDTATNPMKVVPNGDAGRTGVGEPCRPSR